MHFPSRGNRESLDTHPGHLQRSLPKWLIISCFCSFRGVFFCSMIPPYRGLRLNCFQRGACRCSSESSVNHIILASTDERLDHFAFASQAFKFQAMKMME